MKLLRNKSQLRGALSQRSFLLILFVLATSASLSGALIFKSSASAANVDPSPDGQNHIVVRLDGTNGRTGYQLKADSTVTHVGFKYDTGKKAFVSDGIGLIESCTSPTGSSNLSAAWTFKITVTYKGKTAGTGSVQFCNPPRSYPQYVDAGHIKVAAGSAGVATASISGCLSYPDPYEDGQVVNFLNDANGSITGPDGTKIPLLIGGDGCIQKIDNLPPGNYVLDVKQDKGKDGNPKTIHKTITLTAGQDYNLGQKASDINAGANNDNGGDKKQLDCDTQFDNPLTWIICPVIDILAGFVDWVDGIITQQLQVDTDPIFKTSGTVNCSNDKAISSTSDAYFCAWRTFRNIALGLTAIAGLIVVISQALGFEILDAYTIRKVLPRLLIAVIGITLSWPLMKLAIEFTNDLGYGVRHLIYAPFSGLPDKLDLSFGGHGFNALFGTASAALVLGASAVALVIFIGVILAYAGTAALAVLIAILVLVLREVLITLLLLTAPVAIITYVFPNTQRIYKLWWESFAKALMMFPLIAAFIAAGRVFSAISLATPGPLNQMVGFAAYFAPYFLIPATFKLAGGALRQIGGFVNDRSRGAFDRLRNYRNKQYKQIGQDIRSGEATRLLGPARPGSLRSRVNRGLQKTSHIGAAGLRPSMWRENVAQSIAALDAKGSGQEIQNHAAFAAIKGNDDLAEALVNNGFDLDKARASLVRKYGGNESKADNMISAYNVANRSLRKEGFSDRAIQTATMLSGLTASTAMTDDQYFDKDGNYLGAGVLASNIARLSGGDANLQAQMVAGAMEAAKERPEIAPSFSELYGAVQKVEKASSQSPGARNQAVHDVASTLRQTTIRKKGLNVLFGNGHTAKHMAREYENMLNDKYKAHAQAQSATRPMTKEAAQAAAHAEDEWMQMVAEITAAQKNAGNLSLEKRAIVGNLIEHPLTPDGSVTAQSEGYSYRMDPKFQKYQEDFIATQKLTGERPDVRIGGATASSTGDQPNPGGTVGPQLGG